MSEEVPVFILCGGFGTRIKEETAFRPKPMVPIGKQPILWHIMRLYSRHGFRRFILCAGFRAEVIKEYFLNYASMRSDFTVDLMRNNLTIHSIDHDEDWEVTVADTGEETMTGARLALAAEKYLGNAATAAVTYGDGLSNAPLADELTLPQEARQAGDSARCQPTLAFWRDPPRRRQSYVEFHEKPEFQETWINGGFFFFERAFFERYLTKHSECILERAPLVRLAEDGELNLYKHRGFWACMDTQRDRDELNRLWDEGNAPWAEPPHTNQESRYERTATTSV